MAGPMKPNDPNRREDPSGGDDKKRSPLGFFSIVLWAVMLVFLLQSCIGMVEKSSVHEVPYSTFREWVEAGYVAEIKLDSTVYTFTLKEGSPPLKELLDQRADSYGNGALNGLFSQFDR